jgi:acyl carrier protein
MFTAAAGKVVAIASNVLGRPIEETELDGTLVALGFDSLDLFDMQNRVERALSITIDIRRLSQRFTVREFASMAERVWIEQRMGDDRTRSAMS